MPGDDPIRLSADTLESCAERLPTPGYDRSALTHGIVHFGVGGFHRAHQAMYLDRLMNDGRRRSTGASAASA